ncbi:MAG: hybrid sensor histidine kinase/response regulator, partial [Candidatus Rokuibacteriota bacterium]
GPAAETAERDGASEPASVPSLADPAPADAAAATTAVVRPSIRVNLDRLDALMNLAGELVIARARLDRHLVQLEHVGELLGFTQGRMRQAVGEFETKYANPHLPAATGPGGQDGALAEPAAVTLDGVFAELEFDRYDDFNILARRAGELASDMGEVQMQLSGLVGAVRGDAGRVQQLSAALRGEITRSRMVPLGRLFARFARQVRETARTAGKQVALEVAGDAVEVDSGIIDQITDPLLHLIQNAIVHGIEAPEERVARGKPPQGSLRLSAAQRGASLHVEVADDGRGIDAEAVRAAVERAGLASHDALAYLDDRTVLDLIFVPGVSTAAAVTTVAGRGVGMDVVRTNVGRLGGEIEVDTTRGGGTRFTLKLPLTMTISDALFVRVGAQTLAVPVHSIKGMTRVRPDEVVVADGAATVVIEGERLELLHLDRVLGLPGASADGQTPVVVLRTGRRAVAVAVDELLAREEIVVKRLGAFLDGVGPYSGATVSPEGQVILLLDAGRLAERAGPVARRRHAAAPVAAGQQPPRTVLLVDDSVSVRKFVGQMLERAGFRVVTANDGGEALDRVAEIAVDVVVTDLEMPRVNGYELVRDLRRRPATREVPVVVLTTRTGDKHVRLARQLGVEHYVTKPVDEASFVRLVDTLATEAAGAAA